MWTLLTLLACPKKAEPAPKPEDDQTPELPAPGEPVPPQIEVAPGVTVTPVYHGTARIDVSGTVVWIDPWSKANLEGAPKADVVLITDTHFDHLDPDAIAKVEKEGTVFVAPQAVAQDPKMAGRTVAHVLAHGQSATVGGISVTAVPMYNLVRGPEEGGVFHEKGRGNGYIVEAEGKRLYFAGDTECTDEMKALTGIDHAFVPMNLPYTMTVDEAAACVKAFAPGAVTPYHYAGSDLGAFQAALGEGSGVSVTMAEFYPGGLPW